MDRTRRAVQTLGTDRVVTTTTRSQTGNGRLWRCGVHPLDAKSLRDALSQLGGWQGDVASIQRTLELDESQHADLTERVKVFADALQLRPEIRRTDGHTHIRLLNPDGGTITTSEVALAARIEAAYRAVRES